MTPTTEGRRPAASAGNVDRDTLALYLLTSLILIGAEAVLSRSWVMTVAALKLYGLVLLLICSAGEVWRRARSFEMSAVFVVTYLTLAVSLGTQWLIVPLVPFSLMFLRVVDKGRLVRTLLALRLLAGAVVAATVVLSVLHYADFLVMAKLPYGDLHQDTLFHASLASMIKTYGVASTGLNGLVPLQYHVLSHRLMAGLSVLSGVRVLEVYGVAAVVFLSPLLIFAVTWCAGRLSSGDEDDPRLVVRHWLFVCAVFTLLKLVPVDKLALFDSYLLGDSYTLSLALLMFAIPALTSRRGTYTEHLGAVILILLAGLSKGSIGIIGLGWLWAKVIVLPGDLGRRKLATLAVVSTVAFSFLMGPAAASRLHYPFNPFYQVQLHSKVYGVELRDAVSSVLSARVPSVAILVKSLLGVTLFLTVHFFFAFAVILRRIIMSGWNRVLAHDDALLSVVAVSIALGTMMFQVNGGWDFINPAMFVALPFLAAILGRRLRNLPLWTAVAVGGLAAAVVLILGYRAHVGVFWKTQARMQQHRRYGPPPGLQSTQALLSLRTVASGQRVIFERDAAFPAPSPEFLYCAARPFLYPAVTERAWVGVLEPDGACPYDKYGYPPYFTGSPRALVTPVIPPGVSVVRVSKDAGAPGR